MSIATSVAARLKLKRSADAPEPAPKRSELEPMRPAALADATVFPGDTVLGNFKGLAETDEDWEEAIVVGVAADGTYTLEYIEEGLIERGVPIYRIRASASQPPGAGTAASSSDAMYAAGDTVLGNFKGLGDWDEALIVGVAANGTYTLEYVDEGLVEEGVPTSRIAPIDGADAQAVALEVSCGRFDVARLAEAEEADEATHEEAAGEDEGDGDEPKDALAALLSSTEDLIRCRAWHGPKRGYCFKASDKGVGYHKDVPLHVAAEEAEKASMVLTAAQLANWTREVFLMPPSVHKVDRYMDLFDLPSLRVSALSAPKTAPSAGGAPPRPAGGTSKTALFDSLQAWFDAQLPWLSRRCSPSELEVTLRVFLAPQQSVRQGIQHVTFSIDWLRVGGECEGEPLSGAILERMGLAGRRPAKGMLLVVVYRAEKNKITHMWTELDREGLGNKRAATLDDVLVSDAFDRALTIARRGGAVGELNPLFYNYYEAPTVG